MSVSVAIVGRLRSAGFTEEQSQVVAEALEEVVLSNQRELATKADLQTLRADMSVLILKCTFGLAAFMASLMMFLKFMS